MFTYIEVGTGIGADFSKFYYRGTRRCTVFSQFLFLNNLLKQINNGKFCESQMSLNRRRNGVIDASVL